MQHCINFSHSLSLLGGYGRTADTAKEVDIVPKGSPGLSCPSNQTSLHHTGCVPLLPRQLDNLCVLRSLHSSDVSIFQFKPGSKRPCKNHHFETVKDFECNHNCGSVPVHHCTHSGN